MAQIIIRQYTPDPLVHALVSNYRRRPIIREANSTADELVLVISDAFRVWKRDHKWQEQRAGSITHRQLVQEFYADHCKVFTCNEGNDRKGGFAILHGELLALHNVERGCGDWMMRRAIEEGARRLQCCGTPHLLSFYVKHGFNTVEVERDNRGGDHPLIYTMTRNR